jgi:hypothetical protein
MGDTVVDASYRTRRPHPEEPRSGVSKDGSRASWFETALKRLLTMRDYYFS